MDGSVFATAGRDRNIRLYDSHTNEVLNVLLAPDILIGDDLTLTSGHSRRIFALKFHPSEYHLFLTGGWDDSIKNNHILTASWVAQNALQLWELRTRSLIQDVPFPASVLHGEFLYAARFCADDVVLAGGSGTCSALAINVNTQEILGEVSLSNKTVQTVDAARDGQAVAVAGVGGNLHIAEFC
ncbi:uncharacterized protein LOC134908833 isoform X2 [Pseudophryne corroboree]|uniref:uncharacterized protein LOC134908833 isoform X2 n=1 Tax=Pseudophryne corroboree TaxID=495146 RepID=UPI003081FCBA